MTSGQRDVLAALTDGPKTVRQTGAASSNTLGTARGRLRRLEDHGLVRRPYTGRTTHWELTQAGRAALQLTT